MTTLFITSSGTDIGKTFVTLQLLRELGAGGYRVRALKPIASGFDASTPADSDSGRLLAAQNLALTEANLESLTPWRFAAPLSPDMAAARERRSIAFDTLVDFCRTPSPADITLIEGIGGVMVPLDAEHTVLDWIAALRCPVLLVVGSYLGTLSHSLTAAAVLRERGCALAGVIVNESVEQPVTAQDTAAVLARFLQPTAVCVMPRWPSASTATSLLSLIAPLLR
jgi:dethiobiotin synthetase